MKTRWIVGGALLAAAAYFALFGGEYGLFEMRRVRSELETERARLEDVRGEVTRLQARVDSLQNDSLTIERIAREKWGMIRPGERLYRFEEAAPDSAQPDSTAHP